MAKTNENTTKTLTIPDDALVNELAALIEQSKQQVVSHNNSVLTFLFWQVGRRINTEIQYIHLGEEVPGRRSTKVRKMIDRQDAG